MSLDITCVVGKLNVDGYRDPTLLTGGLPIQDYFAAESNHAIRLSLDRSQEDSIAVSDAAELGVDSLLLHNKLAQLTNNPLHGIGLDGVSRVGLILADRYTPEPAALGFMFDSGFRVNDGPEDEDFLNIPREGCAVFLGRIDEIHPDDDTEYNDQVGYTAVHELGHVFNLWHIDAPKSFMVRRTSVAPIGVYNFATEHRQFLRRGDEELERSKYVRPGGTKFGRIGDADAPGREDAFDAEPKSKLPLVLSVKPSQSEFFRFEPVELDIRLSWKQNTPLVLPNEIDPGYERFAIWITGPDGERHRYAPPNRYCSSTKKVRVIKGEPFQRDVSIFGQSGGYTFTQAGEHRIEASLRVPARKSVPVSIRGKTIRSVAVSVNVCSQRDGPRRYEMYRTRLGAREMARLLYYRSGRLIVPPRRDARWSVNEKLIRRALDFANQHADTAAAAGVRYALGRAMDKASQRLSARLKPIPARSRKAAANDNVERAAVWLQSAALEQLQRAIDHEKMTGHRCENAEEVIRKPRKR